MLLWYVLVAVLSGLVLFLGWASYQFEAQLVKKEREAKVQRDLRLTAEWGMDQARHNLSAARKKIKAEREKVKALTAQVKRLEVERDEARTLPHRAVRIREQG